METAALVDIVRRFSSQIDPKIAETWSLELLRSLEPLELCNRWSYLCYSMPNIELAPIWLDVCVGGFGMH